MSGEAERPSWGFLGLMGLIGGGPTFLGTVIGQAWVSEALGVVFFALAAGSILYVVIQLFEVCRRYAMPVVVAWWILAGHRSRFRDRFRPGRRRGLSSTASTGVCGRTFSTRSRSSSSTSPT